MSLGARRIGFVASALLHAAVAGVLMAPGSAPVESAPTERLVALSLDMFEPSGAVPAPPVLEPAPPEPVVQAAPPPLPVEVPEPPPDRPEQPPSDDSSEPPVQTKTDAPEPLQQEPRRPPPKRVAKARPSRRMAAKKVTHTPPAKATPKEPLSPSAAAPAAAPRPLETTTPTVPAVQLSHIRQAYLADLVSAIHRNKYYPRKARRRSEQGTVVVRFMIEQDGRLSAISVAHSSGIRRLDEAALKTLRKLTPFRPIPAALNLDRWSISVPIEFRLR